MFQIVTDSKSHWKKENPKFSYTIFNDTSLLSMDFDRAATGLVFNKDSAAYLQDLLQLFIDGELKLFEEKVKEKAEFR